MCFPEMMWAPATGWHNGLGSMSLLITRPYDARFGGGVHMAVSSTFIFSSKDSSNQKPSRKAAAKPAHPTEAYPARKSTSMQLRGLPVPWHTLVRRPMLDLSSEMSEGRTRSQNRFPFRRNSSYSLADSDLRRSNSSHLWASGDIEQQYIAVCSKQPNVWICTSLLRVAALRFRLK
jgi:hypothetical protein